MKRSTLSAVSVGFLLLGAVAVYCGVTVTGDGFLDLSNLARWAFFAIAAVCGLLAAVTWQKGDRQK